MIYDLMKNINKRERGMIKINMSHRFEYHALIK